jgi:hypothetical protein
MSCWFGQIDDNKVYNPNVEHPYMNYSDITSAFKTTSDIDNAINTSTRQAISLRKKAVNAPTLSEKLAINKEIKAINEIVFKLKLNYFKIEDGLASHV